MFEKTLGILDAQEEGARIECVQIAHPNETPTIEFRHQRHCDHLGWVTQKRITLAPGQFEMLKMAMNMADIDTREAKPKANTTAQPSFLSLVV